MLIYGSNILFVPLGGQRGCQKVHRPYVWVFLWVFIQCLLLKTTHPENFPNPFRMSFGSKPIRLSCICLAKSESFGAFCDSF